MLETDADRERFGVKRRFQMRDGEKFFAEGRDNATFELKQKQMKAAGDYRTALRRGVLAQLNGLGRDAHAFRGRFGERLTAGSGGRVIENDELGLFFDGGDRLDEWGARLGDNTPLGRTRGLSLDDGEFDFKGLERSKSEAIDDFRREPAAAEAWDLDEPLLAKKAKDAYRGAEPADALGLEDLTLALPEYASFDRLDKAVKEEWDYAPAGAFAASGREEYFGRTYNGRGGRYQRSQLQWLGTLFPTVAAPAREPKEPKSTWPAAALALSRSLLRTDALARQKGGVVIARQTDGFDTRRSELASRSKRLELVSPTAWLGRTAPDGGQMTRVVVRREGVRGVHHRVPTRPRPRRRTRTT